MSVLKKNQSVFDLIQAYPELKDIFVQLGLDGVTNPLVLKTAGKKMTLEKGAKMKKIPWEKVVMTFEQAGFIFEED